MRFVNVNGDTAVVYVPERFNLINTSLVKNEMNEAFKKGAMKVLLDFKETVFIDSSALRDIVIIYNRVKSDNFSIINVSGDVYKILTAAKLDKVWHLPVPME